MSDFAAQEEFPMKTRGNKATDPVKEEVGSEDHRPNRANDIRNESWEEGSPQPRRIVDSGATHEIACQSCAANESRNKLIYHVSHSGRMSLPVNGRYANKLHRKTNGLPANTAISLLSGKENGFPSQLKREHRSQSGKINCCGSSLRRAFQERETEKPWRSKGDYFVAVLSYLLGVGNVIRFPQLCFKHGGGAFFIPYFIMLILEGIPLICLEMAIGQRLGRNSVVESWRDLSPSLRGIGVAATLMSLVTCFYYNYIVSWCLYYFIHSMRSSLPWNTCPTLENAANGTQVPECSKSSPAKYYWYRETLDVADDINKSTGINMYLYLFVVASWTISFLLAMRGVRRASKMLLVVLIFIVLNLVTFFFVSVHLDGWAQGLARLFIPEWERLEDPVVWMDAAGQIFYSLGVGFGSLTLFSSGNAPRNNCYMDAIMVALGNCATSLWASIIMFSFFGFKANYKVHKCELDRATALAGNSFTTNTTKTISCSRREIFDQLPPGVSLGFAGLSEAFTEMTNLYPPLWSCLFYLLLFLLSSSSMLGMIEIVVTTCKEMKLFSRTWRNEVICGIFCLVMCISNLLFVQSTGFYLLEIISSASSIPLLVTGLAECIGVAFVYGMDKFSKDLCAMTGKQLNSRWKLCWKFVSPLIILSVIIGGIVQIIRQIARGEFAYTAWDRDEAKVKYPPYPPWAYVIYMVFALIPSICIIYPPLNDCFKRRRAEPEAGENCSDSSSFGVSSCELGCIVGRSRSYNITPVSSPCVNGHVNRTVDEED